MTQDELDRLVLLMCNIEYNHGNISWGGSWAGHAIICLLQDILEGKKACLNLYVTFFIVCRNLVSSKKLKDLDDKIF